MDPEIKALLMSALKAKKGAELLEGVEPACARGPNDLLEEMSVRLGS